MSSKAIIQRLNAMPVDWRATIIDLYDQGASDREVMRELSLTVSQWEELERDILESDFAELVDVGRTYAMAWWESQGRKNIKNKEFNTPLYKFQMSNRYGWSDKNEQSLTAIDFSNMDDVELRRQIKRLHKQMQEAKVQSTS